MTEGFDDGRCLREDKISGRHEVFKKERGDSCICLEE
jgi:hypothetical protein